MKVFHQESVLELEKTRDIMSMGLMFSAVNTQHSNFVVTSIGKNPGLFFEKLPNVYFSENNWKIVVHVDLGNMINKTYFSQVFSHVNSACDKEVNIKSCIEILHAVQHLQKKIDQTFENF